MAIQLDVIGRDDQQLPAVSWIEDRNMFAPGKGGRERVSCFIKRDPRTGELLFASVGLVRHGNREKARPWSRLVSFKLSRADDQYKPAQEKAMEEAIGQKYPAARVALTDGAFVVIADFGDVPMHLNCAAASLAEADELHAVLKREFIDSRGAVLHKALGGENIWPEHMPFVTFKPPELKPLPWWHEWAANATVVAILLLLAALFYWLVG
jgi:hypothetical protein